MVGDPRGRERLRVMTYNIRAGLGTDKVRSLQRTADVIAHEEPDIVALQEVDLVRERSGRVDQAAALGEMTGMRHVGAASINGEDGGYGNAILSRSAIELVSHVRLPGDARSEPRSVMWARVSGAGWSVSVINTHLSFRRVDRPCQSDALLGPSLLGHRDLSSGALLCGDLNCTPRDRSLRRVFELLVDGADAGGDARTTWPTRRPFRRLDYILVSRDVGVIGARVVRSRQARRASDHFPVVLDVALDGENIADVAG